MGETSVKKLGLKRDWALTPRAFDVLLKWLDCGADSGGQSYLEMRRRLVSYFDRKNCLNPDELADEVLNRVTRRLEEEGSIESEAPAKYCYTIARFVFMEHLRAAQKAGALREDLRRDAGHGPPQTDDTGESRERTLSCLDRCAGELDPPSRAIIFRYYSGKEGAKIENRRALAAELGITAGALSVRACRIRDRLEECVTRCLAG